MGRVQLVVGPVDAAIARAWLGNSRRIVDAVRRHRPATVDVAASVLDLIDAYLAVWLEAAERSDPFRWSQDVEAGDVAVIAAHWQQLAAMTDDELTALDCAWAPEWTAPMFDALVAGITDALGQDDGTRHIADDFGEHPPGSR